jgi:hypothetical protein
MDCVAYDLCTALILIAESSEKILKLMIHLGNGGLMENNTRICGESTYADLRLYDLQAPQGGPIKGTDRESKA